MRSTTAKKLRIVSSFLWIVGVLMFFWWPLSHWFLSDSYHSLLGFKPGSYPTGMVLVIGTCGIVPVLLAIMAARDPVRNRDCILILVVFSLLISITFLYLIIRGMFPIREVINVAVALLVAAFLTAFYPWGFAYRGDDK